MIKYIITAVVVGVIVFGTAYFGFYNTPEEDITTVTQAE
tara:strand:- start:758 stop:874 length:117 start_codon:yes stop_codon:yes gene_type:complete